MKTLCKGSFGAGTPREAANVKFAFLFVIQAADTIAFVILAASDAETPALIVAVTAEAAGSNRDIFTGLVDARVMNFRTAFVIFFDRQFFPLTAQVKRL